MVSVCGFVCGMMYGGNVSWLRTGLLVVFVVCFLIWLGLYCFAGLQMGLAQLCSSCGCVLGDGW